MKEVSINYIQTIRDIIKKNYKFSKNEKTDVIKGWH